MSDHNRANPFTDILQHPKIGADNADLDRGLDRRSLHQPAHSRARLRQGHVQCVLQVRKDTLGRAWRLRPNQRLREARDVILVAEHVVIERWRTLPHDPMDLNHAVLVADDVFGQAGSSVGLIDRRAVGQLQLDVELVSIHAREKLGLECRHRTKPDQGKDQGGDDRKPWIGERQIK